MKIYVASSWRNERQPEVVEHLRSFGYEVYDFRNPAPGDTGFSCLATKICCEALNNIVGCSSVNKLDRLAEGESDEGT